MDGGILSVPAEDTREFYQVCVDLINSGTKLYVVEQKTEHFKFFVDLDYKGPEKLSDQDLLQFCSIIAKAVGTSRCLVARARPRPVADGLVKTGVHIHWPDLVVSRTDAMNLRSKILVDLGDGPWDKIIDASVYGGSGLRMLWSHKKPTGDPYTPWRDLANPDVPLPKEPSVELLELFAVRTSEAPKSAEVLADAGLLEEHIRRYVEGQRRTRIKKVQRHDHDGWYAQSDSHYCERIRDQHKSNHVWFSIHAGFVSQRCFDEECAEFEGTKHKLSPSIIEQLNDVVVVGSPTRSFLDVVFPNGTQCRLV